MSPCFCRASLTVAEIPLTRCGLDLQLAQETPDRPSSDLDSRTKGGGKKGCKEEKRCGQREIWRRRTYRRWRIRKY